MRGYKAEISQPGKSQTDGNVSVYLVSGVKVVLILANHLKDKEQKVD